MSFGASIIARLGLDTADFSRGLERAQKAAMSFQGVLGAVFTGFAAYGIGEYAKSVVEYADTVADLSQRTTVLTTAIQKWGAAAETSGSSFEGMAKGLQKMMVSQQQAIGGNDEMQEAFAGLGISLEDLRSLKPEQLLEKIAKSNLNLADASKVLGKSAIELVPTLREVAAGTAELGAAMSPEEIARLAEISDKIKDIAHSIRIGFGASMVQAIELFEDLKDGVLDGLMVMTKGFMGLGDVIDAAMSGNFDGAAEAFDKMRMEFQNKATPNQDRRIAERAQRRVDLANQNGLISDPDDDGGGKKKSGREKGKTELEKWTELRNETAEIERKAAFDRMTKQEQLDDLTRRRDENLANRNMFAENGMDAVGTAKMDKERAELEAEISKRVGELRDKTIEDKLKSGAERLADRRKEAAKTRAENRYDRTQASKEKTEAKNAKTDFDKIFKGKKDEALKDNLKFNEDDAGGEVFGPQMPKDDGGKGVGAAGTTLADVVTKLDEIETAMGKLSFVTPAK